MSEQKIQQLLVLAVKSVKSGDKEKGRQAFLAVLKLDPNNETAWMGLVTVPKDNKERLTALKKVLTMNPNHEKALAVLNKLGIPPERLIGTTQPDIPSEPTPSPEEPTFESQDDDLDDRMPDFDSQDDDLDDRMPDFDSQDDDLDDRMSDFGSRMDDMPAFDSAVGVSPAFVNQSPTMQDGFDDEAYESEPEEDPIVTQSVFDSPPPMVFKGMGVPFANPETINQITQDVEQLVDDYLERDYQFDNIQWVKKTKRRAGEADIWKWRAQVFGIIALILIIFVGIPGTLFITSPEGQRVIFAPTHTITPTYTYTPSSTPGITPTPSLEPRETYTPTPTIDGLQTPYVRDYTPAPTTVYLPGGVSVGANIIQAWDLLRADDYQQAFDNLRQAILSNDPGYPYPYYLQAKIDLAQGDPDKAQLKLEEGQAELVKIASEDAESYMPMYHLGYGEVRFYEAIQALNEGRDNDADDLFEEAQREFETAIRLDARIIPAYIELANVFMAQGEYDDALALVNRPLEGELASEYSTDTRLRVKRGQIYYAQGAYDRALQEANEALYFEPWAEEAYQLQAESAIAQDRPGLANNLLDGYQLVYPDSLLAYKLEGDVYRMEGKADQALRAYNIALQDNQNRDEYLTVLEARADLFSEQRRYELAQESYTEYLEAQNSERVRLKRMFVAYEAQDYDVALRDISRLRDSQVISNGDLSLLEGQILTDTARTTADYEEAFQKLSQAVVTEGVSEGNRPLAEEYLARVNFELGNLDQALLNIDRALIAGQTGSRHYLKGQILQAKEEYLLARSEFEFILAWSEIFPYPFTEDAMERYNEVVELINNPPEDDT